MTDSARSPGRLLAPGRTGRLIRLADILAVAVAVSLPWSTTATGILIALWLLVLLPTVDLPSLRTTLAKPAAGLPVAICFLTIVGMTWSSAGLADQFTSAKFFFRLAVIALLLIQFQRSDRASWVLAGFLVSCSVLLLASWWHYFFVTPPPRATPGVPVKDYIIQSGEFLICAFALSHLAVACWLTGHRVRAAVFGLLALQFLISIVFVATARTTLVVLVVLMVLLGIQRFGRKGLVATLAIAAVLSAGMWMASATLRARVVDAIDNVRDYHAARAETTIGLRLDFWRTSIRIVADAPLIGHGTGSQRQQLRLVSAAGAVVTDNPHNQTLMVAIQLGLLGVALLYAMWLSHLALFRGGGIAAWVGTGLVVQNIVAGLFNSYLFEFTHGWIYIVGVGVLGGMVLRARQHGEGGWTTKRGGIAGRADARIDGAA